MYHNDAVPKLTHFKYYQIYHTQSLVATAALNQSHVDYTQKIYLNKIWSNLLTCRSKCVSNNLDKTPLFWEGLKNKRTTIFSLLFYWKLIKSITTCSIQKLNVTDYVIYCQVFVQIIHCMTKIKLTDRVVSYRPVCTCSAVDHACMSALVTNCSTVSSHPIPILTSGMTL